MNLRLALGKCECNGHVMEMKSQVSGITLYQCTNRGCLTSLIVDEIKGQPLYTGTALHFPCYDGLKLRDMLNGWVSAFFTLKRHHSDMNKIHKREDSIHRWIYDHVRKDMCKHVISLVDHFFAHDYKYVSKVSHRNHRIEGSRI